MFGRQILSRQTLVAFLLIAMLPGMAQAVGFREWFCRFMGIDPRVYDKLSGVRGGNEPTPGAVLAKLNTTTGEEQVIWACDGCWSPVMSSATEIAILKKEPASTKVGIWVLPATRPSQPTLRFSAEGIDVLVGRVRNQANQLLVLQRSSNCQSSEEPYVARQIDLSAGTPELQSIADSQECVGVGHIRKPDGVRNNMIVDSTPAKLANRPRALTTGRVPADDTMPTYKFLRPELDEKRPRSERYHPVWFSDNEVIYIIKPW